MLPESELAWHRFTLWELFIYLPPSFPSVSLLCCLHLDCPVILALHFIHLVFVSTYVHSSLKGRPSLWCVVWATSCGRRVPAWFQVLKVCRAQSRTSWPRLDSLPRSCIPLWGTRAPSHRSSSIGAVISWTKYASCFAVFTAPAVQLLN